MTMSRQPLPVVKRIVQEPIYDASEYLTEMVERGAIRQSTADLLMAGWRWYAIECGGGVRTLTAEMLDERTNEDIMSIEGITRDRMYEIRKACNADPSIMANLIPMRSRRDLQDRNRAAFTEVMETRYGPDGRPLQDSEPTPENEADGAAADPV